MKTIIAGSKSFNDYKLFLELIGGCSFVSQITEVLCGMAVGTDTLGERWAKEKDLPIIYFPPEWELYGKKAGILRNIEMADHADALIAFWDGKSRGTSHMIRTARLEDLLTQVYNI